MNINVQTVGILLLVAALVGIAARRLCVPYTVGLVAAGLGVHFFFPTLELPFDHNLVFSLLLPPLVFEAAHAMDFSVLKKSLGVLLTYATVGVALSALVVTVVMRLVGWSLVPALIFGVVISATDPVAVIATFREAKVGGRLGLLVEAESLFNDGTVAAAFVVLQVLAIGAVVQTPVSIAVTSLFAVGGALAVGAGVAVSVLLVTGRTQDHLTEVTLTTVAAYGSFWLSESIGCSGVLATVVSGMMVSNVQVFGRFTDRGSVAVQSFWEYAGFAANSLIFMMIGMQVMRHSYVGIWPALVAAVLATLVGRAFAVYGLSPFFRKRPSAVLMKHQHVLFWGGLRGALALGLLQALPEMPWKSDLLAVGFGVVTFSVVVQGSTMPLLLKKTGEIVELPEPVI